MANGLHTLFLRVKDSDGRWSLAHSKPFLIEKVTTLPNMVQMEYFIDNDPGYGMGTAISLTSDTDVTVNAVIDLSALSNGSHVLYIRTKDANGLWSISYTKTFLIEVVSILPNIVQMEYFIDSDPGYGKGTAIPLASSNDITVNAIEIL